MPIRSRRRAGAAAVFVLALLSILGSVTAARAQEIQLTGPLAGAPSPDHRSSLPPWMRFDLGPTVSFPITPDLHLTPLAGARLGYTGSSRWQVAVWGAHAAKPPPLAHGSDARIGQLAWLASPEAGVIPLAGRISCLDIGATVGLFAGPALIGLDEREDCAGDCRRTALVSHARRTALAGSAALAFALQPVRVVSLTFDWRLLALERSRGVDLAGAGADGESPDGRIDTRDRELAVDQLITLRLSVLIPDDDE